MNRPTASEAGNRLDAAHRLLGSDSAAAAALAREVVRAQPDDPRAAMVLACALRLCGDAHGAVAALDLPVRAAPEDPVLAGEWGLALVAAGDHARAIAPLRLATRAQPRLARTWQALARALRMTGAEDEAWHADAGAVAAASVDPMLAEAARAMTAGATDKAQALIERYLSLMPDDAAAIRLLGELAWRSGRQDQAIVHVTQAVALAPGFEAARVFLARMLVEADRLPEAMEQADILVARAPDEPGLVMLRASILVKLGEQDAARVIYEDLIARGTAPAAVFLNLGHVAKTLGHAGKAVEAFRGAIARAPGSGEAWWSLANLKTVRLDAGDIAAMRAALAAGARGEDAFQLHFALGKALEDAGEDAEAFAAYAQGNRLRRADLPYDARATHTRVRAHARQFDAAFFAGLEPGGVGAADPIFVVGLPRAGSTLVEQILASHSEVEGTHELPAMMMLADRLAVRARREGVSPEALVAGLSADERTALGEDYLARAGVHRRTDRPRFIDKMPNNWQHLGLIRLILPRAVIVDVRRHPMAAGFAVWKQHFARGQAFAYDLADIGHYYRDYVAQMAAFDEAVPGLVHRVVYEDLVADTDGQIRALLAALDLPFEEGCLEFWRNGRAVRTASAEQVRQPIFTDGLDRWRRFAPSLGPLEQALGPVVEAWPGTPPDWRDWLGRDI
ncbi:sulfotransferase [Novosphingobium nitrogenifigens DSM 19370]|uniref:Sulfotransferase n=1 Tax=Novosphingobium nitrogenifigens DSM 19370 TaxID=983920 RepID=F1Z3G7_9SPHN|nr:tetratricopeptide repeat-containing sulfotransferase family protein [Novosphingobium nitrogenifigens]EGD60781.1 sulfotransferase [Novosphingobium nitrogenifigens DSM 19370]